MLAEKVHMTDFYLFSRVCKSKYTYNTAVKSLEILYYSIL